MLKIDTFISDGRLCQAVHGIIEHPLELSLVENFGRVNVHAGRPCERGDYVEWIVIGAAADRVVNANSPLPARLQLVEA